MHDGHLVKCLAPNYQGYTSDTVLFNTDTTILYASSPFYSSISYHYHTYPIVNRDLYLAPIDTSICNIGSYFPGYISADFKFDKIYWMDQTFLDVPWYSSRIDSRLVWFQDSTENNEFIPKYFTVNNRSSLWDASGKFIDHPVVSAGEAYNTHEYSGVFSDFYHCFNYDTRALNLNFRSRPVVTTMYDVTLNDNQGRIVHFPQLLFENSITQMVSIVETGRVSYPHLVERGSLYENDWQRNHRIYNRRDIDYPMSYPSTIRSSGQYFFKTTQRQPIARQFHGFGDDSLSFGIATVTIGEREYPLKSKPPISPFDVLRTPDTLSTEWFSVDNIETMDVVTTGSSPERVHVWLERQSDGANFDVPLTAGEQLKIQRETI